MRAHPIDRLNIPREMHVGICPALLPSDLSFPQEASAGEKDAEQEEKMRSRDAFLSGGTAVSGFQRLAPPSDV